MILHKPRRPRGTKRNPGRSEHLTQSQLTRLKRSIGTLPIDQRQQTPDGVADERYGEVIPTDSEDTNKTQDLYSGVGYLLPLDEEASTVIGQIIAQSNMTDEYTRIGPENPLFPVGLQYRNVSVEEKGPHDSYMDVIKRLPPGDSDKEIDQESELHRQLWT